MEMGLELEFRNIPEMDCGVVVGVGGHTEFCSDGICLEMRFGNIPELDCGVVVGVGRHMEFCSDGICLEMRFGNIPELVAESCVPLHPPPLQGSDVSALLMIMSERG